MKILVTGGAGFIGSAVIRQAISAGHRIINLDALTYAACLENVASVAEHPNYRFIQGDIRDRARLDEILSEAKPDAIMHLAAESHVDRSIDGPGDFVETNILGTYHLLEAARAFWTRQNRPSGFRFHHISTDEVFGSLGTEGLFTENSQYAPNSPYSASKASSDHLVRAWGETYDLPVLISNCSNNYGPYQFPEKLIPVVILNAIRGKPIPVYGTGQNIRDWLFVEDHADALLTVLRDGTCGQTYNIGGENEVTNLDLVHSICAVLDDLRPANHPYADQISFVADRPGHDARYAIDPSKMRNDLNWRPSMTLDEGIKHTVTWYLDNTDWIAQLESRQGVGERLGQAT
ncbi:UNVERIFIED_CONTAM: hypothetical protein GTU68_055501 [Idotea baltica]|nr:hypothetical protein [Idotea baltica]